MEKLFYKKMKSPVGVLTLVANEKSLVAILWPKENPGRMKLPPLQLSETHKVLNETEKQLQEYFAGQRQKFELSLEPFGTAFQQKVWKALQQIPYGQTLSYGELAQKLGLPNARRAVGAANGRNPISIVVPCHRVIGANGKLTGFAGGLETKSWLLEREAKYFCGA